MRRHHLWSLVNQYHTFLQSIMWKRYIFTTKIWLSELRLTCILWSKASKEIVLKLKVKLRPSLWLSWKFPYLMFKKLRIDIHFSALLWLFCRKLKMESFVLFPTVASYGCHTLCGTPSCFNSLIIICMISVIYLNLGCPWQSAWSG